MAEVNPPPRRRIRAAAPQPEAPPRRRAPEPAPEEIETSNALGMDPYDGPPIEQITATGMPGAASTQRLSLNARIDAIAARSRKEAEELFYQTLHQFLLAKTPPDVICARMGISFHSLRRAREYLNARIRTAAKERDPYDYIGPMIAEMEEAKSIAWREVALANPHEWTRRMRAIDTVMRATSEMGRILQVAGMFDNQPMRQPLSSAEEDDGANVLKELATNFLTGGYQANAKYRASPTPADTVVYEDGE